jgi:hypothetical protein
MSLAVEKQQQDFARRARQAEMRRRRRRMLKQQKQEQKERELALKEKRVAKGAAMKQDPSGCDGTRSKRRGEERGAELGRRTPPPPPIDSLCSSAASRFPLEASALLPVSPLPSPLPSPPPLAPRGGLAARRAASLQSHRSPISEFGPVPVLDEIPGALAVFEEEEE